MSAIAQQQCSKKFGFLAKSDRLLAERKAALEAWAAYVLRAAGGDFGAEKVVALRMAV